MEIRNGEARVLRSSLHNDKLLVIIGILCIVIAVIYILVRLFVSSFLAVGITSGIILVTVDDETSAVFR